MNKKKKEFVLDCCNSQNSKLRPYESKKDLYLAGFFAVKDNLILKNGKTKSEKLSKKKKQILPQPYITKFPNIKHSHTTKSLPPIDSRRNRLNPLSRDEFQALISKYRQDL
jgi:hypothetical protein